LHKKRNAVGCDLEGQRASRQARSVKPHRSPRTALIPVQRIQRTIARLRGHNVIVDQDLAALYDADVRVLNQAVKRGRVRFPADFIFQVTAREADSLRSQIVILNAGRGRHRKYRPYVFTEQGLAMLSSVLRSRRAVRVNIEIMRAFVRVRQAISSNAALARALAALERKGDGQFEVVFEAIRGLMAPPATPRKPIGFRTPS
jgi:hypothetical protein